MEIGSIFYSSFSVSRYFLAYDDEENDDDDCGGGDDDDDGINGSTRSLFLS